MASRRTLYPNIFNVDFEKQRKRWERWLTLPHEPEPAIGLTPRQEVWKKNKATLWYYPAQTEQHHEVPVFLLYSLFNKPYILDLAPGNSLIEGLVKLGYNVYLLDWGVPGLEDSHLSFADYIYDYLHKAVKRALRHSGAEEISLAGYCLGGTVATIYASLGLDVPIRNLAVWTIPIDFSKMAVPKAWLEGIRKGEFNLDRLIEVYGVIPSQYIDLTFRMRTTPFYNFVGHYAKLFANLWNDQFVEGYRRMNKWTEDHVPFAGEAYRQLVNDLMRDNKLVTGEFVLRGQRVDLSNVKANLLVITGTRDDLILQEQSFPLMNLVSSEDKTYQELDLGHMSLVLSRKLPKMLDAWLATRSDTLVLQA